jgi:hypothetical protein
MWIYNHEKLTSKTRRGWLRQIFGKIRTFLQLLGVRSLEIARLVLLILRRKVASFCREIGGFCEATGELCRFHRRNCTTVRVNLRALLALFSMQIDICQAELRLLMCREAADFV